MSNAKKKDDSTESENHSIQETNTSKQDKPVCGLIMPIADTEGYPPGHWKEVRQLLISIAEDAGFRARIVSESDDVRVIQATIVQNVYEDDLIICDVSSKNPNVMFELGLRLAFDKATVIVKDNVTGYSFDTSPVEHINYPKDLRYYDIEEFRKELKAKLLATYKKSLEPNHSMYLQSFGKFEIKGISTHEVTNDQYVIESLREIKSELTSIKASTSPQISTNPYRKSAPAALKSTNEYLTEVFSEYLSSVKEGAEISRRAFYQFIKGKEEQTGIIAPSQFTVYDFFNRQIT